MGTIEAFGPGGRFPVSGSRVSSFKGQALPPNSFFRFFPFFRAFTRLARYTSVTTHSRYTSYVFLSADLSTSLEAYWIHCPNRAAFRAERGEWDLRKD